MAKVNNTRVQNMSSLYPYNFPPLFLSIKPDSELAADLHGRELQLSISETALLENQLILQVRHLHPLPHNLPHCSSVILHFLFLYLYSIVHHSFFYSFIFKSVLYDSVSSPPHVILLIPYHPNLLYIIFCSIYFTRMLYSIRGAPPLSHFQFHSLQLYFWPLDCINF